MLKGQAKKDYQREYMRLLRKAGKLARHALEERQARDRALLDPLLDPVQPNRLIPLDDETRDMFVDAYAEDYKANPWIDADGNLVYDVT